jgi:putative MATE family efflux protein
MTFSILQMRRVKMMKKDKNLPGGNTMLNLLAVSVPTMIGFVFQMGYDLIDIAWVGRISSNAVAGVTIFATIFWTVDVLNEIIGASSISLISQNYGKGDMEQTAIAIEQTLTFKALVAMIASGILLLFLTPLLYFFTSDQEVIQAALDFGYIRTFFLPVMFSSYTLNTAFRCIGDAKKPMLIMSFSAITNMILDPLFMFDKIPGTNLPGLHLGVFGAALATVISITCAFILAFVFMLKNTKVRIHPSRLFRLHWAMDKKLLTIGLPSGLEMLLRNLVSICTLKLVAFYGTPAVAALGIGNRLFAFAVMVLVGLSMGGSAIIGQCLGANDIDRAKITAKQAAAIGSCAMAIFTVISLWVPGPIIKIFTADTQVLAVGIPMVIIGTLGLVATGVTLGLGCVFSGSGYNLPFLISSFIARWGVQVPLLFFIVMVCNLPIIWVWWAFFTGEIVEMLIILIAFKQGKWQKIRVC